MIRNVNVQVTTREHTYTITLTGEQIEQTVRRRMKTLAPGQQIIDLTELTEQGELLVPKARRGK